MSFSVASAVRPLGDGTYTASLPAEWTLGPKPPGGFLLVASCSHNVDVPLFAEQVARGLDDARRTGRILRTGGAAADHPVHPHLPETAYLKAQILQLD